MKLHLLQRTQDVPAPLAEVFPFFAAPENLEVITPPSLRMQILTPSPIEMREGALFDYCVTTHGVPMRWTTLITTYTPPHLFVDVQLKGPYSFWHHTHRFEDLGGGRTRLIDEVRYVLPFGPLGALMHALVIRRDLEGIFEFRRKFIAERFGS